MFWLCKFARTGHEFTLALSATHHSAAPPCTCANGVPGTRLVWAAASYYNQPCKASGIAAPLPKCELFYWTGKRFKTPSSCAGEEPTCYIEVQRGASKAYVIDRACSTATSNIGRPGNPACPGTGRLALRCRANSVFAM